MKVRTVVALAGALVLAGCYVLHPDRHINLVSERDLQRASFLLVDKTDYTNGAVIVSQIDSTTLSIELDPCVYVLSPGEHVFKFEYSGDSPRNTRELSARLQEGSITK